MSLRKSIRWRIQSWHGLLLFAVIGGFCITSYRLEHANQLRMADHELEIRLTAIGAALTQGAGGSTAGGPPPYGNPGGGPPNGNRGNPGGAGGNNGRPQRAGGAQPGRPANGGYVAANQGRPADDELPPDDFGDFEELFDEPQGGNGPMPGDGPGRSGSAQAPPPQGPPPGFSSNQMKAFFNTKDPEPYYYVTWTRRNTLLDASSAAPANVPRPPGDDPAFAKGIRTRDGVREAFLFTPPGECLLVGRSLAGINGDMTDFAWKLAGIGGSVLVAGLAIGWWIASRAMRPISDISAAATRIAAGHFDERIRTEETESELGKLATLLDDTFQRLDTAFDEQARFTSDAAHELRTPVSIILGQAQLALSKERSPGDYRAAFEICQRAAKRMHGLIESLLQLSVLDAAPHQTDVRLCDLAELTHDHTIMMQVVAAEKNIRLREELSPAPCHANPDQIGQILMNLLTNAVKYSPEGAEVRAVTRVEGDFAVVSVRDNGPGIPAEHLPHLFDRFYRADTSRNRSTGGAGLGLAICKRIADAHNATLTVESVVGMGTAFTLRVPMQKP
ncbi:HAMP domain-containing sensor histidine kinase [Luteolibacter sp. LG18]|uniref:sensor histidine kinase n=1 Tax=Luteolibacter sp. LG18 TaxID=2819286 RepID=UPI002B300EBC|nr:hypothetical protein llg_23340 [Luteolibacter sp. LG18]